MNAGLAFFIGTLIVGSPFVAAAFIVGRLKRAR